MAQDETLVSGMAGRYASALFTLAQEQKSVEPVAADLAKFDAMIADSADLRSFVRSPVIAAETQVAALDKILKAAGITGLAANFIKLVASKRRLFALRDMIRVFAALHDSAKGVTRAEVTVAEPLSDAHLADIKSALQAVTMGKSVEVGVKVDPSIIGGLIVKLGSRMVDGSLKTKLSSIRSRMKEAG